MIVMKFGGTSILDAECIRRVCRIVHHRIQYQPVIVNSAMGKVTRRLLAVARLAAEGNAEQAGNELEALRSYHDQIIQEILTDFSKNAFSDQIKRFDKELTKLKDGVSVLRDLTARSQDKFLSYGELISTTIITAALRASGVDAVWCDARELIITDDRFTHAQPITEMTYAKLADKIHPLVNSGKVPVIQGFIGATREGATTTLGFEGSDFTAALVGAALDVKDVQIWKDVPGVMTADPEIFPNPLTVKKISFDEAAEISFFGAKVLHPSSIAPARQKGIPVHVLNSMDPENRGTELSLNGAEAPYPVTSITYKRPVYLLALRNDQNLPFYDYFKMIFDILDRERLTPYLVNIAERSVKMVLSTAANLQHLMDDFNRISGTEIYSDKATVSLIGQRLVECPAITGRIAKCLDNIRVDLISHGASNMNATAVINADQVETAVDRLHKEFFQEINSEFFESYQGRH
ncbi:aspartate kinase [bacterium]|nr:aspartate kinase [bacterium]